MLAALWDEPAKSPGNRTGRLLYEELDIRGDVPGRDALTVTLRSPRAPAGGPLLEPERPDGWRQRIPILSERKGEIAAKSCSYAHNRRMSHPQMRLQRVGGPDTEENDRVHHPRTGNDCNQEDTDIMASWKRHDRPWFALLEFALLVEVPREISAERDTADCTMTPTRNKIKDEGFCGDQDISHPLGSETKIWWVDAPVALLYPYDRGVAQVCKIH